MKSILRNRVAAAALLLSPFVLAAPAQAQLADVLPSLIAQVIVNDAYRDHRGYDDGRRGWRRDERAPVITSLTPIPGDHVGGRRRTEVSARFDDRFSGVDPASVRLRVDGRDVTHESRVSDDEIRFRDQLAPGRHVAEVIVRDRAGNTARRSWQFDVSGYRYERPGYGYGYGNGYGQGAWAYR